MKRYKMKTRNAEMSPLHELSPEDAIDMLVADHKRVANLFAEFKRLTDEDRDDEKASVVQIICQELTIHTQLEEELFYPAVREAIDDPDQMDEALVEHAGAKQLIAQLQSADPADDLYDAKVTVLGEQIDHHVEEEEGSMFPKARHSGLDTLELGAAMLERKAALQKDPSSSRIPVPVTARTSDDAELEMLARSRVSTGRSPGPSKSPPVKSKPQPARPSAKKKPTPLNTSKKKAAQKK